MAYVGARSAEIARIQSNPSQICRSSGQIRSSRAKLAEIGEQNMAGLGPKSVDIA